jgi:hypothetical protein
VDITPLESPDRDDSVDVNAAGDSNSNINSNSDSDSVRGRGRDNKYRTIIQKWKASDKRSGV